MIQVEEKKKVVKNDMLIKKVTESLKHGYSKKGAVLVPSTVWVQIPLGYHCLHTLSVSKIFQKKKKKFPSTTQGLIMQSGINLITK